MTLNEQMAIDANDFIEDADGSLEILCYACLLTVRASMAYVEDAEVRGTTLKLTHKMEREVGLARQHMGGPSRLHLKVIRAWFVKFVWPHRYDDYLSERFSSLMPKIEMKLTSRKAEDK